jgi:thiol:disulfide interchange protein DsbD
MSAPYLILSFKPRLLNILPKPGEWMESFRQLMAFPLLASAIWLIRVFTRQLGLEPPALDIFMDLFWGILVILSAFWILYRGRQSSRDLSPLTVKLIALTLIAIGIYTAIPTDSDLKALNEARVTRSGDISITTDPHGLLWESYSEPRLAKILAQGRNVLLDFTAEWCITCKVNSKVVFSSKEVRELLIRKDVTLMRGDWTSKDSAITSALNRYGRSGVPLNLLLRGPESSPVEVFPNILTPGVVIAALEKLPE